MKNTFKYIILLASLLLAFSVYASSPSIDESVQELVDDISTTEQINHMDISAEIHPDASVSVVETIEYNFGDQYRHGIFRTIPLGFTAKGEPGHTEIDVTSVTDESGNEYEYDITSDDPVNVKIGSADTEITGKHIYKIEYILKKSIGFFPTYDEWYWNLTGDQWPGPIQEVTATVILPKHVDPAQITFKDYCGRKKSTTPCGSFSQEEGQRILYKTNRTLNLLEQVTIAVGFPKGLVVAPTKTDLFLAWFARVWFLPLPFLIAFLWFRKRFVNAWKRYQFLKKNTIVAEYDAGEFTPFEVALLVNKSIQNSDISAVIVSLAVRGYIKIENTDGEFSFTHTKKGSQDLTNSEKIVFDILDNASESDIAGIQVMRFIEAIHLADSKLVARDYITGKANSFLKSFARSPAISRIILPLFFAVNPGAFIWLLVGNWAGFAFSGGCVLIAILSVVLKPVSVFLTEKGFEAERKLLGLKLYIKVAEEERIKFANAPAKTPELFEKLLPYAMIFGLEKKWAKEFEGLYTTNPSWYSGGGIDSFSTIGFIGAVSSMHSSVESAMVSSIGSSSSSHWSSSSGGSSGGGSSGGGGGGGGGGSW